MQIFVARFWGGFTSTTLNEDEYRGKSRHYLTYNWYIK